MYADSLSVAAKAAAAKLGEKAGERIWEKILEKLSRGKVTGYLFLIYIFENSISADEIENLMRELLRNAGVDDEGRLNNEGKVTYSFYTLLDDLLDSVSEDSELELTDGDIHELLGHVLKLIVGVELYKWSKGAIEKAYSLLAKLLRRLNELWPGRFRLYLYMKPPRKIPKKLKVIYADKEVLKVSIDPFDYEQVSELLKLPGWF